MDSPTWLSVGISCICVGLISILWRVLVWIWLRPKRLEKCFREQGFQGISYRFLFGDTRDRAKMVAEAGSKPMSQLSNDILSRVLPFHHHIFTKYGTRCIIWTGPIPVITISEPDMIREVLMKINDFQKPKSNPVLHKIATGLLQLEGQQWHNRRKLINPAFHMEKIKVMFPALYSSSYEMVKKWDEMVSDKGGSCEVDVLPNLIELSADAISKAAFGSCYDEGRRIFQLISQQIYIAVPILNSVYIPGWRFIPTKTNRRITKMNKEIKTLLKGIILKRKMAINDGEKYKDDLLGVLLDSSVEESEQFGNEKKKLNSLRIDEVINECKIFYLAGQETTSMLLVWTLILLGKHQDWQQRAREEVINIFGRHNTPDFHRLNNLKMVHMILQEVLRLYPPVIELNRTVTEDIKLQDIYLPAGVLVSLPILHVQQDEKLWGIDAKEFNPNRFKEGISKATGGNMSFFSFGWGPRICIGSNFAMTEAKLTLSMILQHFAIELSPSYCHAPTGRGTLRPQYGAQIILHQLK